MNTSTYPYRSVRPSVPCWLVAVLTLVVLAMIIGVGVQLTKSESEPILTDAQICDIVAPSRWAECMQVQDG